jgi:hypothetical protein
MLIAGFAASLRGRAAGEQPLERSTVLDARRDSRPPAGRIGGWLQSL